MLRSRLLCLAVASMLTATASAQETPPPRDVPYAPGPIGIEVDATNLGQRIMRVRETISVQAGPLTLLYPEWLPGGHSPLGPIEKIAGIRFTGNGQKLTWKRDPADVFAFHLDIPEGVTTVIAQYDYLTPTDGSQGRVVMTPSMLNLQWNAVLLYPAGHYGMQVQFDPKVKYPSGWQASTSLDVERRDGDTVVYMRVPFDILADSPVYAGKYYKQFDLAPGAKVPVRLNVVADDPKYLETKPEHLEQHRELVRQAVKLYGAQHYDHYDFLLSLSEQMAGNGLEHQRSSENGQALGYFSEWDKKKGSGDLLGHEYTHSWNGKFRRPADQWMPNLNQPMQDSLLWVYEGQTQYWGNVLTARSGLLSQDRSRDGLAMVAATYRDNRPGLAWRSVQDTTNDPIIAQRRPKPYRNYQLSEDYYSAGQMIWLEADVLIRNNTNNRKSLDDFAKGFFGVNDGKWQTQDLYDIDDVVASLNSVMPYDWHSFLRDRLDGRTPITNGIEASGWKLVYQDEPNAAAKSSKRSGGDYVYSLGLSLNKDGKVGDVRWDSPAFAAGIGSGMTVVAVNDVEYTKDVLDAAVKAAKGTSAPVRLMLKDFNRFRTVNLDYHDGLRYPALERIQGKPDYLTAILNPRK
ncbi:MAG: M61 family peptidase [Thermomonas sp.]